MKMNYNFFLLALLFLTSGCVTVNESTVGDKTPDQLCNYLNPWIYLSSESEKKVAKSEIYARGITCKRENDVQNVKDAFYSSYRLIPEDGFFHLYNNKQYQRAFQYFADELRGKQLGESIKIVQREIKLGYSTTFKSLYKASSIALDQRDWGRLAEVNIDLSEYKEKFDTYFATSLGFVDPSDLITSVSKLQNHIAEEAEAFVVSKYCNGTFASLDIYEAAELTGNLFENHSHNISRCRNTISLESKTIPVLSLFQTLSVLDMKGSDESSTKNWLAKAVHDEVVGLLKSQSFERLSDIQTAQIYLECPSFNKQCQSTATWKAAYEALQSIPIIEYKVWTSAKIEVHPCITLIEEPRRKREAVSSRKVTDRYILGSYTVNNPDYLRYRRDYETAYAEYLSAKQAYNIPNQASNNPLLDFANILNESNAVNGAERRLEAAKRNLNQTPPTIIKNTYTEYQYNEKDVNAEIAVNGVLGCKDKNGRFEYVPVKSVMREQFIVSIGKRDRSSGTLLDAHGTSDVDNYLSRNIDFQYGNFVATEEVKKISLSQISNIFNTSKKRTSNTLEAAEPLPIDSTLAAFMNSVLLIKTDEGSGSGFYIVSDIAVTNAHVVGNQKFVTVLFENGEESQAKVLRTDPSKDIALLRVLDKRPPIALKRPSKADLAKSVITIGHPNGFNFSVTKGLVSAIRHQKTDIGGRVEVIQTDTAVSPGNSGGPLILNDRAIGMITYKWVTEASEGLAFAVSAGEISDMLIKLDLDDD